MIDDDELFRILRDQNDLDRIDPTRYLHRKYYLDRLKKMLPEKGIIVIQGPRRSGKTTLMKLLMWDMVDRDKVDKTCILYINLEDFRLSSSMEIGLLEKAVRLHRERIRPDGQLIVLIDEIQNIDGFERYLRTCYDDDRRIKFLITGSNSRLLSRELGTLLTGRTHSLKLFPFSFREFMEYREGTSIFKRQSRDPVVMNGFLKYLTIGGLPEFLDMEDPSERQREYIDQILFRDIMSRFDLRNERLLREMAHFLMTHSSSRISISQMSRTFGVSKSTIMDYLSYLEQAYLIHQMKEYNSSAKEMIRRPSKIYSLDPGLVNSLMTGGYIDSGMILENVVYLHLLMSGLEIYYQIDPIGGAECDFLIRKDLTIVDAIQVTRNLKGPRTFKREVNGLLTAVKRFGLKKGRILNLEREGSDMIDGVEIKYQLIPDFLLDQ